MNVRLKGFYTLNVGVPGKPPRLIIGPFPNLITDSGLNRLGSGNVMDLCSVGTGSTPPSVTDNALVSTLATTTDLLSSTAGAQSSEPYYGYRLNRYYFQPGTVTGNIAEVGVGWNGGLFSRALTADEEGDPAVITVLASEGLEVTYEVRLYPPDTDDIYTETLAGVTRTCTARAALATSGNVSAGWGFGGTGAVISATDNAPIIYEGDIGSITSTPAGFSAVSASRSTSAYSNNSLQRDMTALWTLASGNFASGISSVMLYTVGMGAYQIGFDPPIAKTADHQLSMTFRLAWQRI